MGFHLRVSKQETPERRRRYGARGKLMVCQPDKRLRQVDVAARFGENLVRCRKSANLSQEELGFRASLHRTEIGMLERGIRLARIDTLIKLAGALEVPPEELLGGLIWTPSDPRVGEFGLRD
jgi:DNA-binding XRE family transcriptional regulator